MSLSPKGIETLCAPWRVQVGRTRAEVVYREGKMKLLRYLPRTTVRSPIPLLFVYALVNRPYILDLLPRHSVVEHFLKAGFDVYLIDWGIPDQADRWNTLSGYITGYTHRSVETVKQVTGAKQVSLLGYSQGGTFAAIYTALYPAQVRNLILLATPIDFGVNSGLLHFWSRPEFLDVDKLVDAYGNIPPSILNGAFVMLKPIHYLFDKYVRFGWSLLEGTADDASVELFLALEKWLADGIPHPGETFREFVKACYQDNRLVRNLLTIDSQAVDLRRITCSVCNLIAEKDHLIPPQSSLAFNDVISSPDKACMLFPCQHVELSVGSRAANELWPRVVEWLAARSH